MDVLEIKNPELIMRLDLPLVMDMLKAKIRLEESKAKARKTAEDLAAINKK